MQDKELFYRLIYHYDVVTVLMRNLQENKKNIGVFESTLETLQLVIEKETEFGENGLKKMLEEKYDLDELLLDEGDMPERVKLFIDCLNEY